MASRGWYAEKMNKLRKCKIAEMKERDAISAIDHDQEQEDWLRNYWRPDLRNKSEAPLQWKSLGATGVVPEKQHKKKAIYENALTTALKKTGMTQEQIMAVVATM